MHYPFFGPARMDEARTVTELAVYAATVAPFVLLGRTVFRPRDLAAGLVMIVLLVGVAQTRPPDRAEVGWGAEWFAQVAEDAAAAARQYDIPRPTFANTDLGAASWRKTFNMIDLGMLGSSITARSRRQTDLLLDLTAADIIELHDLRACLSRDLFQRPEFRDGYLSVRSERTPWLATNCDAAPEITSGMWVRRAIVKGSGSDERNFLDRFRTDMTVALIRDELGRCLARSGDRPCGYVGRTLYRFVPELKAAGSYAAVAALLKSDARLDVEHAFFTSSTDPLWWRRVLSAFNGIAYTGR
jgi:hypothetical protein